MYKNFISVMNNENITFKQIGELLGCRYQTVSDKVNGEVDCGFTCDEAIKIKNVLFPKYDFNYLFDRETQGV